MLSQCWHFTEIKAFISAAALVSETVWFCNHLSPTIRKSTLNICIKQVVHPEAHTHRSQVKLFYSPVLQKGEMKLYSTLSGMVIVNPRNTSKSLNFYLVLYRVVLH